MSSQLSFPSATCPTSMRVHLPSTPLPGKEASLIFLHDVSIFIILENSNYEIGDFVEAFLCKLCVVKLIELNALHTLVVLDTSRLQTARCPG